MTFRYDHILFGLILFPFCIWNSSKPVFAQSKKDTLKTIQILSNALDTGVEVKAQFLGGQGKLKFDSSILNFYRELSLAELITDQSPVFVKTYGVNSMATLSIRGASAAQSSVLWNGIPINNAALGLSDISTLNGSLFSEVSLQYGGSGALLGSGNVGGALILGDQPVSFKKQNDLAITLSAGSFGRIQGLFSGTRETKYWHISVKGFIANERNDFPYTNLSGITERMANAHLRGGGGVLNIDHLFRQVNGSKVIRQTLSFKLWIQNYNREIPPALFESSSEKKENDFSLHSLLDWEQKRKRSRIYAKLAYSRQDMNYRDGVVLPDSRNGIDQINEEIGWSWQMNGTEKNPHWQNEFLIFSPVQFSRATGTGMGKPRSQFRPALAGAYQIKNATESVQLNFAIRAEWWRKGRPAYLPGINGRFRLFQKFSNQNWFSLSLLGNLQHSYRVPTLNELYFSPGGNPDLNPERGWNEDGGLVVDWNLKDQGMDYQWKFSNQTSFFNRNIKDWIYWLGGAIWTPHNLAAVHSRGVETNTNIRFHQNKWIVRVSLKTAYVLAITTSSYLPNDGSIGSQIPYTPRYNESGFLAIGYSDFYLNYNHNYTGYRFVTTDESLFLRPFQTGNLMASYTLNSIPYRVVISGQIRNLWNQHYEVVNGRPMPGRNFLLSLTVERKKG